MKRGRLLTPMSLIPILSLLLFTSVYGDPSFQLQIQNFGIRFFPEGSVTQGDCFMANCVNNEYVNFYLADMIQGEVDPCTFANSLINLNASEFEADIFDVNTNNTLDINLASFFRTFYGSSDCESDLSHAMQSVSNDFKFGSIHPVTVNIIEKRSAGNLTICDNTTCSGQRQSVINFIIPSWCQATCGVLEATCNGSDYHLSKKQLDYVIARFEIRRLLHQWSSYIDKSTKEISLLSKYKGNHEIDYASLVKVHTKLNEALFGAFSDELQNSPSTTSLDHALGGILAQQHAKKSVKQEGADLDSVKESRIKPTNILSHKRTYLQPTEDSDIIF